MLAFGAVFELPLLLYFLSIIGMVTHRGLWKFNRWFIVIAFVVGAILTPTPDVVSQLLMALPMIVPMTRARSA
jgi:sec-independent protein translocase protein TatC